MRKYLVIIILSAICGLLLIAVVNLWIHAKAQDLVIKAIKIALKDRDISLSEQEIATAMAKLQLRNR